MKIMIGITALLLSASAYACPDFDLACKQDRDHPRDRRDIPRQDRSLFSTDSPRVYDSQGRYRGNLNRDRFDPDSINNKFGQYGNPYSPDSLNNRWGAGNPYNSSPIYVVPR